MSINIKINNYDTLFVPDTPLSDMATINEIFIERSGQKMTLTQSTNNIYVYNEPTYEVKLYINELPLILEMLQFDIADGAKSTIILDANDTIRTSYLYTSTSESGTVTSTRRIIPIDIGTVSPELTVHKITDNNNVTADVKYFVEVPVTVGVTTLNVGIIEVPELDNATQYFDITINSSDNTSTLSYIAKNTDVDPNGLNRQGTTLTAFNTDEDIVLDDAFVYAKLISGTTALYFKLLQSTAITVVTPLDVLKRDMSNKWFTVFNESTAVLAGTLTNDELYDAEFFIDANLRTWLTNNNKTFFDVSNDLNTLIDVVATKAKINSSELKAYNDSNVDVFNEDEVLDLGASIATTMLVILNGLTVAKQTELKHTINWFRYISTRDVSTIVTPNITITEQTKVLSQAKSDYQNEFSHAAVIYNTINSRYLEFFIRKLNYIKSQLEDNLLSYEVSVTDVSIMILALTNIKNLSRDSASFDTYTEASIDLFVNKLEFLKIKPKTIQRIKWI